MDSMGIPQFVYPFIYCWWLLFPFLRGIMNKAAINIHVQVFVRKCVFISLGCMLLIAGSYGKWLFNLRKNCKTVFQSVLFYILISNMIMSPNYFTFSPTLNIVSLLNFRHSGVCLLVVSYCWFYLHFSDDYLLKSICSCAYWTFVYLLL